MQWAILKKDIKRKLIIEKYGQGNAVVVFDSKKIIDLFVDPPSNSNFYPPNTFVEAKIQRRISKRGGYFVRLPNGYQGFLKSSSDYNEGTALVLLSKVFFDEDKPQTFTDKLKVISKYFVLKLGEVGFSFSKKTPKSFNKATLVPILKKKIKNHEGIFVICRSQIADISFERIIKELEAILEHYKSIKEAVEHKKKYCDGKAKKSALDVYDVEKYLVIEEEGIFERLGLWDKINELSQKKICISHGSSLSFEQTSAFFAIDVNSGKNLQLGASELNLIACSEICRLIKVLGIGGKIIIDFLPCPKSEKTIIYNSIVGYFLNDIVPNKIWGWTNGGSFELERKRDKSPLKLLI